MIWYDMILLVVGNLDAQSHHGDNQADQSANKHLMTRIRIDHDARINSD